MQGSSVETSTGNAPNLAGTYTDSLGDSGAWTASGALFPMTPRTGQNQYTGTFNSTTNPLMIPPSILILLGEDAGSNVTGTAAVSNFPCVSTLTLAGEEVGDAFVVGDTQAKIRLVAVPTLRLAVRQNFAFSYRFDASAPSCGGDVGAAR
jgi:hypothetical protein